MANQEAATFVILTGYERGGSPSSSKGQDSGEVCGTGQRERYFVYYGMTNHMSAECRGKFGKPTGQSQVVCDKVENPFVSTVSFSDNVNAPIMLTQKEYNHPLQPVSRPFVSIEAAI